MLRRLLNLMRPKVTDRAAPPPRPLWTIPDADFPRHAVHPKPQEIDRLATPIETGPVKLLNPDANFVVWHKSTRGTPWGTVDYLDPRTSLDWNVNKQSLIAIYPLTDEDRRKRFADILLAHPCPTVGMFDAE